MYENVERENAYCAKLLSTLGNKRRLLIMCHLQSGEISVGKIAEIINLSQSALSQHLAKLRAMNLVQTRRDGQTIYYSSKCGTAENILQTLERALEQR